MNVIRERKLIEERLETRNFINVIDNRFDETCYTSKVYALTTVSGVIFGVVLDHDTFKVCSLSYKNNDLYGTNPIETKLMSNFEFKIVEQPHITGPTWDVLCVESDIGSTESNNDAVLQCKTFLHVKEEQLDDMLNAFILQISRKHHMEIKNVNIVQGVVLGDIAKHNTTNKPIFNKLSTAEYTVVLWYEVSPK